MQRTASVTGDELREVPSRGAGARVESETLAEVGCG